MKLFKTIDKVLAGFGNPRAMQRNHVDTYTENLIQNVKGEKIAASEFGQLFVTNQHLNGYDFLNVSLISAINIKSTKGCILVFEEKGKETIIQSDTLEIESDFSNVSNRYLTKMSFILDYANKKMIEEKRYEKVKLVFKKKSLPLIKC